MSSSRTNISLVWSEEGFGTAWFHKHSVPLGLQTTNQGYLFVERTSETPDGPLRLHSAPEKDLDDKEGSGLASD